MDQQYYRLTSNGEELYFTLQEQHAKTNLEKIVLSVGNCVLPAHSFVKKDAIRKTLISQFPDYATMRTINSFIIDQLNIASQSNLIEQLTLTEYEATIIKLVSSEKLPVLSQQFELPIGFIQYIYNSYAKS